jgi:flagellum-specific ATP synthase
VDIARASLDGQGMLSRALADAAHYPAIDLTGSISRVMQNLVDPETQKLANLFRRYWTLYQQNLDLIQVGAYQKGANPELDIAIAVRPLMEKFLQQGMHDYEAFEKTRQAMLELMKNRTVAVDEVLEKSGSADKQKKPMQSMAVSAMQGRGRS